MAIGAKTKKREIEAKKRNRSTISPVKNATKGSSQDFCLV